MIKIKCPKCGAVLVINKEPSNKEYLIPCSVCNVKTPFKDFIPVKTAPRKDSDSTEYKHDTDDFKPGKLVVKGTRFEYQLKEGRNTIGREADSSHADFQIPEQTRQMSREHFCVDVVYKGSQTYHVLTLAPGKKNPTYYNDALLNAEDKYVLHNGDSIKIGSVTILFTI